MKQFELPYFGTINIENITEEQSYMNVAFQNRTLVLMWFPEEEIEENYFQNATRVLSDLDKFDTDNRLLLQKEFTNTQDKTVLEYLEFYLEELHDELSEIIGESTKTSEQLQKLLNALKLNTIAFHDSTIVADYVLNEDISDQILAIAMYSNGATTIAWES